MAKPARYVALSRDRRQVIRLPSGVPRKRSQQASFDDVVHTKCDSFGAAIHHRQYRGPVAHGVPCDSQNGNQNCCGFDQMHDAERGL
jgi:hypothetical protein